MTKITRPQSSPNNGAIPLLFPRVSSQRSQDTFDETSVDETTMPPSTRREPHDPSVSPQVTPPTISGLLSQEVLEMISLHQVTSALSVDPASHITNLEFSGKDHFMLGLVVCTEGFLKLPLGLGFALQDRIQRIRQRCGFAGYPRHERPNINTSDPRHLICELQRYEDLKTDYLAWPDQLFDSYALVFISQAFGRLQYALPANIGPDGVSMALALLISLCEDQRKLSRFIPPVDLRLRNAGPPEACGQKILRNNQEWLPEAPPNSTCGSETDEPVEDDTALDNDADMDGCDRYCLLTVCNNDQRHILLRVFGLHMRILETQGEEGEARRADACVLCEWPGFADLVIYSGLGGAISSIESHLPQSRPATGELLERLRGCERSLKMSDFSFLQPPLPDEWMEVDEIIDLLQRIPRFLVEISDVNTAEARALYATACLAKLGSGPPKDVLNRLQDVFNRIWCQVVQGLAQVDSEE